MSPFQDLQFSRQERSFRYQVQACSRLPAPRLWLFIVPARGTCCFQPPRFYKISCHGAPSSAPCPEPRVRAKIIPMAGRCRKHPLQESWDRLSPMLSHPPHGAEPAGEVCPPLWGQLQPVAASGGQTGSESVQFSSRINLVMAHIGAPQRTVIEGIFQDLS